MAALVTLDRELDAFFAQIEKTHRERFLETPPPHLIDLCSNDYLGLAEHTALKAALHEGVDIYGAGSTASRLVRGHRDVFAALEKKYAAWVGAEDALFVANGYAANVGAISALCDASWVAFIDRLAHASLVDGVRLSGARKVYFKHNDLEHLAAQLAKHRTSKKIIIGESLFSMDGDFAPLSELGALAKAYDALLYIDDAHALGVYGHEGRGEGLAPSSVTIRMATFGKALGLEGAMLATSARLKKYLLHKTRTFVFSTAPLPAIAHAALTAIDLAQAMQTERRAIAENAERLRQAARAGNYSYGTSASHIVPIICKDESAALQLSAHLAAGGFHARAIRPPTVEISRVRIAINARLKENSFVRLCEYIRTAKPC